MSLPPSGRKLPPLSSMDQKTDTPSRGRKEKRQKHESDATERTNTNLLNSTARERRRRSQSRERTQDGHSDNGTISRKIDKDGTIPVRSRRKEKAQSKKNIYQHASESQRPKDSETERGKHKVMRKRKKKRVSESQDNLAEEDELNQILGLDVQVIRSDIITVQTDDKGSHVDSDTEENMVPVQVHTTGPMMKSQPTNRLYIERSRGFKSEDKTVLARKLAANEEEKWTDEFVNPSQTTLEFAVSTQKAFKTLALFCHGILAGFSIWQTIMVYSLSGHEGGDNIFLEFYRPVAHPVQAAYFFLLVICTVSVFDRYDIAHPSKRFFLRAVTLQSGAIAVLFYFVSLIMNVSIQAYDDRIGNHYNQTTDSNLWSDASETSSILNLWRGVNAARAGCAVMGWIIVSLRPGTDRLTKNLKQSDENLIGEYAPAVNELVANIHPPGVYKSAENNTFAQKTV